MNRFEGLHLGLTFTIAISLLALPQPASTQTDKGIELYNTWHFQEAEKVFRDALNSNPQNAEARYYLGVSILHQERYTEALDLFLKLENDRGKAEVPDEHQVQIALARAHLGLKRYPEAWKSLESAEKAHAASPDVHVYRGACYVQQEKPQEAIKELEKAISLDRNNPYAYYYAGHAYLLAGNPARAVEEFKIFLELAPYAPEASKTQALVASLC